MERSWALSIILGTTVLSISVFMSQRLMIDIERRLS